MPAFAGMTRDNNSGLQGCACSFSFKPAPLSFLTLRNRNAPANFRIGVAAHGRSTDR
jgi:hypothetical protein